MRILPHGRFFANPPAGNGLILGSLFSVEQVNDKVPNYLQTETD
jgi:hypothetical protein